MPKGCGLAKDDSDTFNGYKQPRRVKNLQSYVRSGKCIDNCCASNGPIRAGKGLQTLDDVVTTAENRWIENGCYKVLSLFATILRGRDENSKEFQQRFHGQKFWCKDSGFVYMFGETTVRLTFGPRDGNPETFTKMVFSNQLQVNHYS